MGEGANSSPPPEGGAPRLSVGRDEGARAQWGQAILLGVLIDLFVAPAFGFPIMSGGPRFGLFFAAIGVGAVVFTLIVKALRRNRAVHLFEDRLELVEGSNRRTISLREARQVVFDPARQRLQVGRDGIRLSPGDGLAVVRALAERQEAQPSHSTSAERGASATRPEPSGP